MSEWLHADVPTQGYVRVVTFGGVNQGVCLGGWIVVTQGYVRVVAC